MSHRNKIGDLFAILLPNNKYAYGRLFLESSVVFYKHRGISLTDVPAKEDYEFIVCVHKKLL